MTTRINGKYKSISRVFKGNEDMKEEYLPYTLATTDGDTYVKECFENAPDQEPDHDETLVNDNAINITYTHKKVANTVNPSVWGPSLWFTLHNGAARYPENANQITKDRMKGFILGIPYILPCLACKPHAISYIENRKDSLDTIVSTRENLVKFFVDFHNKVNERYKKPLFTYEDAVSMYDKGVNVTYMKFK